MNNILYYTTYDLPVPYKNLKIYPVRVKDYLFFSIYSQCLLIDKNSIPDPKIISMTDLEFLYKKTIENVSETPYLIWFDRLLSLCLSDDKSFESPEKSIHRYKFNDKGKPVIDIEGTLYDYKDFEEIKEIIAEQNSLDLIDKTISKEVRDALEKAKAYKSKIGNANPASIEDYIVSVAVVTGWSLDYINNMTIRKFTKAINRYDNLIHYKIFLSASMSGMVEFKDKSFIKHWLTNLDSEDKYKDVSLDLSAVQDKVSLESAKKSA